jgi:hypothetical protein
MIYIYRSSSSRKKTRRIADTIELDEIEKYEKKQEV